MTGIEHHIDEVDLLAPILPTKIIAVAKNYADHASEMGGEVPAEPMIFLKPSTAVIGPEAVIRLPEQSERVEHEAELAVVIGRLCKDVPEERAAEVILGYTCANDVTARDLQATDGQWGRAKGFDTFCPLGPWIVTADEIADPHDLPIRCTVNGQTMQSSNTDQLIFRIPALIEFLSHSFTLLPGDIILTGTPPGVGHYANPPHYLRDGDIVTIEIDGIGKLRNVCRVDKVVK